MSIKKRILELEAKKIKKGDQIIRDNEKEIQEKQSSLRKNQIPAIAGPLLTINKYHSQERAKFEKSTVRVLKEAELGLNMSPKQPSSLRKPPKRKR